jgi:Fur family ferric uptake transcriptional regulator
MKATKPRIELVEFLFIEKRPVPISDIYKNIGEKSGMTTVYRTLERLVKSGIVQKIQNSKDDCAFYEIRYGRPHHHHIICTSCGDMEDVLGCDPIELNISAHAHLKKFKSIQSHSLEFFGLCRKCEKLIYRV